MTDPFAAVWSYLPHLKSDRGWQISMPAKTFHRQKYTLHLLGVGSFHLYYHNIIIPTREKLLIKFDEEGELPVYIDGCYVITQPRQVPEAIKKLKSFNSEFNTKHLKVHTLKIFNDGTLKIETAALVTPYVDTGDRGTAAFNKDQIESFLFSLMRQDLTCTCTLSVRAHPVMYLTVWRWLRRSLGISTM